MRGEQGSRGALGHRLVVGDLEDAGLATSHHPELRSDRLVAPAGQAQPHVPVAGEPIGKAGEEVRIGLLGPSAARADRLEVGDRGGKAFGLADRFELSARRGELAALAAQGAAQDA